MPPPCIWFVPCMIRSESADALTAAPLAFVHAARLVRQLAHDQSGFFEEFYRLFVSGVVLGTEKEQLRKETGDKTPSQPNDRGQQYDLSRCVPKCSNVVVTA
ncbi:hypothetical protein Y032_0007g3209 [Ancylostoma ceylanicum]|uniref:Uncharacterized protein n=1 Tax=Ancylostoma ceylanicum TaxID=53326 RepID=A0A016VLU9_9BILA|nr:hypothetical protein Y032_0007g3209 [Ancylostoma ceylanicum]